MFKVCVNSYAAELFVSISYSFKAGILNQFQWHFIFIETWLKIYAGLYSTTSVKK